MKTWPINYPKGGDILDDDQINVCSKIHDWDSGVWMGCANFARGKKCLSSRNYGPHHGGLNHSLGHLTLPRKHLEAESGKESVFCREDHYSEFNANVTQDVFPRPWRGVDIVQVPYGARKWRALQQIASKVVDINLALTTFSLPLVHSTILET